VTDTLDWAELDSSFIAAIRFEPYDVEVPRKGDTPVVVELGTLYLRFQTGSVYRYDKTHVAVYRALLLAESPGGAYNDLVPHGSGVKIGR
jgi:hypothetical protein